MQAGQVLQEETRVLAHQGTIARHLDVSGLVLQAGLELVLMVLELAVRIRPALGPTGGQLLIGTDRQALIDLFDGRGQPPDEAFVVVMRRLRALGVGIRPVRSGENPARTRAQQAA